jgi:hypothetical protein
MRVGLGVSPPTMVATWEHSRQLRQLSQDNASFHTKKSLELWNSCNAGSEATMS